TFILNFTLCGIVFLLAMFLIKYINYHDPLSPILERFIADGDPVIMQLSKSLKNFSESKTPFPLGLFIPRSLGYISTILGACTLLLTAAAYYARSYTKAVCTICIFILLTLFLGQATARFFIEPY